MGVDQAKYSTSPKGEEETALWIWASSNEYSDGGSGELSGDDLARFHGLVLPRSRGFGDEQPLERSRATSSVKALGRGRLVNQLSAMSKRLKLSDLAKVVAKKAATSASKGVVISEGSETTSGKRALDDGSKGRPLFQERVSSARQVLSEALGPQASVMASAATAEKILAGVVLPADKEKVDRLTFDQVVTKFLHVVGQGVILGSSLAYAQQGFSPKAPSIRRLSLNLPKWRWREDSFKGKETVPPPPPKRFKSNRGAINARGRAAEAGTSSPAGDGESHPSELVKAQKRAIKAETRVAELNEENQGPAPSGRSKTTVAELTSKLAKAKELAIEDFKASEEFQAAVTDSAATYFATALSSARGSFSTNFPTSIGVTSSRGFGILGLPGIFQNKLFHLVSQRLHVIACSLSARRSTRTPVIGSFGISVGFLVSHLLPVINSPRIRFFSFMILLSSSPAFGLGQLLCGDIYLSALLWRADKVSGTFLERESNSGPAHEIGDKESAKLAKRIDSSWASTVIGALVPVLMASSLASKSRIFCEVDLSHALGRTWCSVPIPRSFSTDVMRTIPRTIRVARSLDIGNGRCSWGLRVGSSEELYKAGVVLVHDPHLFGYAMYFVMETFQIWNLASVGHGRCSIIQGAASTWSGVGCGCAGFWGRWSLEMGVDQAKYSTSPKGEEETALWIWASSNEYSDGGSGELSGDDLARFHGLVLPRSRGFGDEQPLERSRATSSVKALGRGTCLS
ncbi:hypothetical protein Acr_19g0004130 [Actinidia rufa]|uniref:Uncharacterized protein n=1 Tax=Actinidia rufa TaxID=165716 RepID=A0A7J0G9I4_9ERIC|nr:hypothetical protein Acr_19g0004130 [Actinidia rufa]